MPFVMSLCVLPDIHLPVPKVSHRSRVICVSPLGIPQIYEISLGHLKWLWIPQLSEIPLRCLNLNSRIAFTSSQAVRELRHRAGHMCRLLHVGVILTLSPCRCTWELTYQCAVLCRHILGVQFEFTFIKHKYSQEINSQYPGHKKHLTKNEFSLMYCSFFPLLLQKHLIFVSATDSAQNEIADLHDSKWQMLCCIALLLQL